VIFEFVRDMNKILSEHDYITARFWSDAKEFLSKTAVNVLGIAGSSADSSIKDGVLENNLIDLLIKLRNEAKKQKNYALSDQIRDELNKLGIQLQDLKDKTTFRIKRD
jgi:cysteinyl-tRNA synthetase